MGRIGNSLSHLVLALSQTLQTAGVDALTQSLSDASFQGFAFMTRELDRLMSTLTLAQRKMWTLRTLSVIPGQMFGPAVHRSVVRKSTKSGNSLLTNAGHLSINKDTPELFTLQPALLFSAGQAPPQPAFQTPRIGYPDTGLLPTDP
eukprot:superscaffoldBa00000791_g7263